MTRNARILCVDDEPGILRALKWVLNKDYKVSTATSGKEALKIIHEHDFEVIISDQRMPGMMGADLLEKVRDISPNTVRILLTGYSDIEYIVDSINKGEIFRFIHKPWNIPDLKRIVSEAVEVADELNSSEEPSVVTADDAPHLLLIDDDHSIIDIVKNIMVDKSRVMVATNFAEIVTAFEDSSKVGVIISDLNINGVDVSALLKYLKSEAPEIATIVVSSRSDSREVIGLINHGQVYRFVFKPAKPGVLKIMIQSAFKKHAELIRDPACNLRHKVEKLDTGELKSLLSHIDDYGFAQSPESSSGSQRSGGRIASVFSRLFGR
ncbi:MAG: response regulator [Gammaproteobacteria bacterium]|nr:response regulator [Gammaproteobacteria bacterium]